MNWQLFKNRFRWDARQAEAEVNIEALWEAMEPEIDALNEKKKKKRRFFFLLFWGGALALGASWWILQNAQQKSLAIEDIPTEEELVNTTVAIEEDTCAIYNFNTNFDRSSIPPNENGTEALLTDHSKPIALETPQTTVSSNYYDSKEKGPQTLKTTITNNESSIKQTLSKAIDTSIERLSAELPTKVNIQTEAVQEKEPGNLEIKSKQATLSYLPTLALHLPKGDREIPELKLPTLLTGNDALKALEEETIPANEKRFNLFAAVHGGVSFVSRSLSAKAADNNALLGVRERFETPLDATHYGLSLGVEHQSGFYFQLGYLQTTITERFDFNEQVSVVDSIMGVHTLRINITGDTIPIEGMIPRTTTTTTDAAVYNTYRLIDLPVTIGYNHYFNERWSAGVQAGIAFNIALRTKGKVLNESLVVRDLGNDQASIFESNIGLSYHFGLSLGYQLTEHWSLQLEPSARFLPKDFSVENYGIAQQYLLIGGNLRVRYSF